MPTTPSPTNGSYGATPDSSLPLATLSASGTPPKARLFNATQASDIFWNMHDAAQPRLARAAVIRGMFDGNPPFDQRKRRNAGQAYLPNFNTLEAASRLEAAKAPYYDLFSTAAQYADCSTALDGEQVDASTASRVRSDAFDTLLRSYSGFDIQFWTMLDDFIAFNRGFLWFPRPDSWHFKRLPWHRVLFPQGTSADPDEWELFAIEHRWPAHKLWSFIDKEQASTAAGWNRPQVIDAIRRAAPEDLGREWNDPMQVQRDFRDSDFWINARMGVIRTASLYVREFNGTWTRMMIEVQDRRNAERDSAGPATSRVERESRNQRPDRDPARLEDKSWLYFKQDIAKTLYEIMTPFVLEAGDGAVNELAGLGKRIVSYSQAIDRLMNETAMNTALRSNIVLQAQTGSGQAKAGVVQIGGGTCVIPPGYAVQPGTIFGDIQGSLAVQAEMRNRLDVNTGIYRPQLEKPSGNPETLGAAQMRFSQATVLGNSAVNRYYTQLDKFYAEIFRRVTMEHPKSSKDKGVQASLAYQKACSEAGLTKTQCTDAQPGSIRAMRAIGNGSPVMRQQNMAALGALVPYMGPRGLLHWKIDYAAAYTGQRGATRYFPSEDTAQVPTRDDWDATQENSDFSQGNQPIIADWQNHQIHAQVHLTAAMAAIQSVLQGGADPAIPFTFLQVAMPHIGEHISRVPREQIRKELSTAYQKVAQGAQQVFQAAKEHMQQQGQQQQLSLKQQLDVMATQHEIQIKDAKNQAQMRQREERQRFDMRLAEQQEAHRAALTDAQTAHTITTGTAKTVADIQSQEAKTAAAVEAQRAKAAQAANKGDE